MDRNADAGAEGFHAHLHRAAFVGELQGVGQQVAHYLNKAVAVTCDLAILSAGSGRDMDAKLAGITCGGFHCLVHEVVRINGFEIEFHFAGLDLLHV